MDYLGSCDLFNDELKDIKSLRSNINNCSATLIWFEKQKFYSSLIKQEIEVMQRNWQNKVDEIINSIRLKAKSDFPNGKRIVISYELNEVKVYG